VIGRFAVALLAVGASLGGLYAGTVTSLGGDGDQPADGYADVSANTLRTELMATPLVTRGGIYGYIIGRYVLTLDADLIAERSPPVEHIIAHAVNSYFYDRAADTFWLDGPLGVDQIADGLKGAINESAGGPLVTAFAIRQLDYLQSPEIRQPVISFDR